MEKPKDSKSTHIGQISLALSISSLCALILAITYVPVLGNLKIGLLFGCVMTWSIPGILFSLYGLYLSTDAKHSKERINWYALWIGIFVALFIPTMFLAIVTRLN